MKQTEIKIGVIGLGMGCVHIEGYRSHPRAKVTAICDKDRKRLHEVAQKYGITKTYTNAEAMFAAESLDAVSVCTPNKFHAPLTMKALDRGLHVLCEKPIAMNTAEAVAMNTLARKRRRKLTINYSSRFFPTSLALKREVDKGTFGEIYFGRTVWHRRRGMPGFGGWFGDKKLAGGGPLIDLGVHRLDLALWLMGFPEPASVSGVTCNRIVSELAKREGKKFTVEDLACGMIKFTNGATLIIETSWALNIKQRQELILRLCGTKGGLSQEDVNGEYTTTEIFSDEDGYFFTRSLDFTTAPTTSAMFEFVDSILGKRPPIATGDEGIKVMKILDGIYESARTGREVRFR